MRVPASPCGCYGLVSGENPSSRTERTTKLRGRPLSAYHPSSSRRVGTFLFLCLCLFSPLFLLLLTKKHLSRKAKNEPNVSFLIGVESEFILLKQTNPIEAVSNHGWSNSSALPPGSVEAKVLEEIADALNTAGIELQMYQAEAAPGQYEVVTGRWVHFRRRARWCIRGRRVIMLLLNMGGGLRSLRGFIWIAVRFSAPYLSIISNETTNPGGSAAHTHTYLFTPPPLPNNPHTPPQCLLQTHGRRCLVRGYLRLLGDR